MRSNFPLILALFLVLTTVCESKHFCEAFLENGEKVDFVFRRMLIGRKFKSNFTDPNTIQYFYSRILLDGRLNQTISVDLIIKGQYWRLIMADPRNGLQFNFENNSYEGRDANFFNGYRMGADIPDLKQDFSKSAAVLFSDSNVILGNIPGDNHKIETDLNGYQELKSDFLMTLKLPNDTNITLDFAFPPLFPHKEFVCIDFATKTKINGNNGLKTTRYGIQGGLSPMATRFFPLEINSTEYTIFKTFNTKYDIIGFHSMPDSWLDWTLFILLNDQKRVLFCMTLHDHISDYCGDPVELIDCFEYTKPDDITATTLQPFTGDENNGEQTNLIPDNPVVSEETSPGSDDSYSSIPPEEGTPDSSKRGNAWIWILFIFIIIVVIVAIILIVWYFMKKTEESQTLSKTNAEESGAAPPQKSGVAERTSISTPPKTQTNATPKSGADSGANTPQDTPQESGPAVEQKPTGSPPKSGADLSNTRSAL